MKVALISDTHWGTRGDSVLFHNIFKEYYEQHFFPELISRNIKTIVHLGDFFDRRKFTNHHTLALSKEYFFDQLLKHDIKCYMLVGNHDTAMKNTNELNSLDLLVKSEYQSNIRVFSKPEEVDIQGELCLFLPWINTFSAQQSTDALVNSNSNIVFAHLELSGFKYLQNVVSSHGQVSRDFLEKFPIVLSGHYHEKSSSDNIHYLGSPMEFNWGDCGSKRGFHILTGTDGNYELEFIQNPFKNFIKLYYNDTNKNDVKEIISKFDEISSKIKNKYVKLIVEKKQDLLLFEEFADKLYNSGAFNISIVDMTSEILAEGGTIDEDKIRSASKDTFEFISDFINSEIQTDLDKETLKNYMRDLLVKAQQAETV